MPIELKFIMKTPYDKYAKLFGHTTKMADMPI